MSEDRKRKMSDEQKNLLFQACLYNNKELLGELLTGDCKKELNNGDAKGQTALHAAAYSDSPGCIILLVEAGADVNVCCSIKGSYKTPLHVACERGNLSAASVLVDAGADLYALDSTGNTPLELAQRSGHQNILEFLQVYMQEKDQRMASAQQMLEKACMAGNVGEAAEILESLGKDLSEVINAMPSEQYTLLYRACERGQVGVIKLLLKYGADGRIHPVTLYSPLYMAVSAGHREAAELILSTFPDLVQVATFEKWLPIHAAARNGNIAMLKMLLTFPYPRHLYQTFIDSTGCWEYELPCDVNALDTDAQTPLHLSCMYGHQRTIKFLLDYEVPAHPAASSPTAHMRVSPASDAAELEQSSTAGPSKSEAVQTKLIKPVCFDLYSAKGRIPLHEAVINGHSDCAKFLIERGSDVNLSIVMTDEELRRMENEELPIMGSNSLAEACRLQDVDLVSFMLEKGATDTDHKALAVCLAKNNEVLTCRFLCANVFADPEFRVNKKNIDLDVQQHFGKGRQVLPSSLSPSAAVMLNWHNLGLPTVKDTWLMSGAIHLNAKLKPAINQLSHLSLVTAAITRIDLSKNDLTTLPLAIFQMVSLRILNVANNKIESLPVASQVIPNIPVERGRSAKPLLAKDSSVDAQTQWNVPVLEEIHLQCNRLDQLPEILFELSNLVSLDVSSNQLTNLPNKIWFAPKLKDLNAASNRLESLPVRKEYFRPRSACSTDVTSLDWDANANLTTGEGTSGDNVFSQGSPAVSVQSSEQTTGLCDLNSGSDSSINELRFKQEDNVSFQELKHHNLWQKTVELSLIYNADEVTNPSVRPGSVNSCLTSLNLSHNQFETVPDGLACLAPSLGRLNLSFNSIVDIGPVNNYPARLKHLDLSHNHIKSWFQEPRCTGEFCHNFGCDGGIVVKPPSSPVAGRRSQSIHRKSTRSLSVAASRIETAPPAPLFCVHRRHNRLENLRTLLLASNHLVNIQLYLLDSSISVPTLPKMMDRRTNSSVLSNRSSRSSRKSTSEMPPDSPKQGEIGGKKIVFPSLSMLDLSDNHLTTILPNVAELTCLSVLNLSNNVGISQVPPEMGLLSKLWNLNLTGCSLGEPLKSMLESRKYKTVDIIGYLKSILEDSKSYARLKLMIVGVQGIGKTSLLEQLRQEGTFSAKRNPAEGWARRMGNKDINRKTAKGSNISTVGIDIGDWTYEPKKAKGIINNGPVTFRTWDFGGQREYYATHQYFLSKRSLYLVVWKITDGEAGVSEILQWLVNIQARAPNSLVLIVGTHFDEVLNNSKKFPTSYVEDLQRLIKERFVGTPDADKKGLPKVVDSVIVSCKTRYNIKVLRNILYQSAFELRSAGTKERLLDQKIPSSYLALEDVVASIAQQRKDTGKDPVLNFDQYQLAVQEQMWQRFKLKFRDTAELSQATAFLHENGMLLHYEDATLKDLYFLDPQWLCDVLAHVITIREINPFAKNGLMKTDDLKILFKASRFSPGNIRLYILNLLQKFEVALTWDNRTLLIPCLLPDEYQLRGGYNDCEVKLPVKMKGYIKKTFVPHAASMSGISSSVHTRVDNTMQRQMTVDIGQLSMSGPIPEFSFEKRSLNVSGPMPQKSVTPIFTLNRPKKTAEQLEMEFYVNYKVNEGMSIRRLYLMSYFPSGFWSRLITRMLGEENVPAIVHNYLRVISSDSRNTSGDGRERPSLQTLFGDKKLLRMLDGKFEWLLWQTGMEIQFLGHTIFSMKEFLPLAEIKDVNYKDIRYKYQLEGNWVQLNAEHLAIMELYIPFITLTIRYQTDEGKARVVVTETDSRHMTRLLATSVDIIDTLLEDWYPSLGTRFVHTSEGKFLVTRLVPCPYCLQLFHNKPEFGAKNLDNSWTILSLSNSDLISKHVEYAESNPSDTQTDLDQSLSKSKTFDAGFKSMENSQVRRMSNSSQDSGVAPDGGLSDSGLNKSSSTVDVNAKSSSVGPRPDDNSAYSFTVEECILAAHYATSPKCPAHGLLPLNTVAPDTVFLDLGDSFLVLPEQVKRGKMLGRGAFGFVFKASVKFRGAPHFTDVAMKMLQPVDPGFGARPSAATAYKAAWSKWQRDPSQYACRAYCTARQELNVLTTISHSNIVSLVGVCQRPLALVIRLAPMGSLNHLIQNYKRSGAKINSYVLQDTFLQVAKAMEYLHQMHIIYRDLKSENVLCWQFPPPFSHLTIVDVKLGDYGISRSILPSGGTKGFGGTEGFMAPEIMRFNGEEEYTEKADCFSFGMFMYEMLTLKLPFDGQEQVKEYILEGGRPALTLKEMSYPSNLLDLMIVCWSQQPADRPSASQIVSMCSAPELAHLLDVVAMNDSDAGIIAGDAFIVEEESDQESADSGTFEGEIWLSRSDGTVSVLSCNQYGWLDYKSVNVNEDSFVTVVTLVEETVWLGELTGLIRVYCAKSYAELYSFSLAPHIYPVCDQPLQQLSVPVSEIIYSPVIQRVVIAAGCPGVLLSCLLPSDTSWKVPLEQNPQMPNVVFAMQCPIGDIKCLAALPPSCNTVEMWAGGTQGSIAILNATKNAISFVQSIGHTGGATINNDLIVNRMITGHNSGRYVFSYVCPGCTVYQWDVAKRVILAKLDCSKLAPCSESISTINIEDKISPTMCQITSMCLLEKEDGSQLYIGTTWGVVVVADADELRPVTAFRPHMEDLRIILPVGSQRKTITLPSTHRLSTSSVGESARFSQQGKGKTDGMAGVSQPSRSLSWAGPHCVVTVGKGYRNLVQRFIDAYKEDQIVLESRTKDYFAAVWSTDEWVCN